MDSILVLILDPERISRVSPIPVNFPLSLLPRLFHEPSDRKMKNKNSASNCYYQLTCGKLTILAVSAVIIKLVGLCLFVMGFFPVKPTLSGMSGLESFFPPDFDSTELVRNASSLPPEKLKHLYQEISGVPPLFDRLIFMVIDGLPAEFVLGKDGKSPSKAFMEAMPYTQSLLATGFAIGYHAKAAPPTVTMPRLKAMVSGAVGGFLDVALNFNSQAFLDDNLIAKFFGIGRKLVMLGDETWLKLFPNMFTRHDGVTSFFVKDTVQVDYNVSRHLADELNKTDWDILILHYLGLDHVGHIGGRSSILMGPKLMEMDEVIRRLHSNIMENQESNKRTLLMIVSDHGMTEVGNHGGSSYEETDSLAVFVGAEKFVDAAQINKANQVDIAATLALLLGVPIPKNNVGTVMPEVFSLLEDEHKLRVLQLNSWQLLRLLQTHLPEMRCERVSCVSKSDRNDIAEKLCCSYLDAATLHDSWKSESRSRPDGGDDYKSTALAYHDILRTASAWLSSRATDKPIALLGSGMAAMLVSCFGLMILFFLCGQDLHFNVRKSLSRADSMKKWHLDESFTMGVIFILVLSMGSSSMVEEEQYIWHFMTSSLYLILLRKTIQSFTNGISQPDATLVDKQKMRNFHQMYYIFAVLISGRILRGWHQGGVNWTYLPDISKYLQHSGGFLIKSLHLISLVLVITICLAVLLSFLFRKSTTLLFVLIYSLPVLLILNRILQHHDGELTPENIGSTTMIQVFYTMIGISTMGILVATPWLMPLQNTKTSILQGFRGSLCLIGWCYVFSWCLLQLMLQQSINAMPILLLLLQIIAIIHFSNDNLQPWVKVAALYYIGMAGHFGFGNTNTLATVDVAGAFIGMSSHSTMISGILMFMITYASPMLALLSMLMNVDFSSFTNVDFGDLLKMSIGYSCLVPLGINSIVLLAYTIVLLLMQSHLFVWSVFSPKYLYVCATTACVCIGVSIVSLTAAYISIVFSTRLKFMGTSRNCSTERLSSQ